MAVLVPALLRMEIACFSAVAFIAWAYLSARRERTYIHKLFATFLVVSGLNILLDGATVWTVNNLGKVPQVANDVLHKLFLSSLCAVVYMVYLYTITLVTDSDKKRRFVVWEHVPFFVGLAAVWGLPVEYVESVHGNYSMGPYAYAGYASVTLYLLASMVFSLRAWRGISPKKRNAIGLALLFISVCLVIQALVPHALISAIGVTAIVLALFMTVESPDAQLVELLKTEKEKANAANDAKTAFLANMSHEIRTPINAVLGFDEMIIRESQESQIVSYARDIETAGKTLLGIINDVLDFSKIEAGKMTLVEHDYELSQIVNEVVNMVSFRAKSKGIRLEADVDGSIPNLLHGDDVRIKQVMLNIMNNAVKYTERGSVTLGVAYRKDEQVDSDGFISASSFDTKTDFITLDVSVTDTGIGIKPDEMQRLFSPFERIDETRNSTIEGAGLGMSIVKRILEMMGTKIQVQSQYGKGSVFSFSLRQRVVDWAPAGAFVDRDVASEPKEPRSGQFHAPTARILVVDDVKMNLMVISALLKSTQVTVSTAMSGQAALDLMEHNLYDLVFLDHRMPGMDGIETLRRLKLREGGLNDGTPVIALTANVVSGAREMYLASGFTDYLAKPVDMKHLEQALLQYLPKSKIQYGPAEPAKPSGAAESGGGMAAVVAAGQGEPGGAAVPLGAREDAGGDGGAAAQDAQKPVPVVADDLPLDDAAGVANCGGEEPYRMVLAEFCDSSEETITKLEGYRTAGDFDNYAIIAHSVKSSARTIGATRLAEEAALLEQFGNNANATELAARTLPVIDLYRRYVRQISAHLPVTD